MDIFNNDHVADLEQKLTSMTIELTQANVERDRLKQDVDTLEKDNVRLRKLCGESKSGPAIVSSNRSEFVSSAKKQRDTINQQNKSKSSSNSTSLVEHTEDGIDIMESITDVGEAIGEVIGAVFD